MARFDVYRNHGGPGFLLDVQANALDHLNTRLVVPLLPVDLAPIPARRLNPLFTIEDAPHMLATQFAATILTSQLGRRVTTLSSEEYVISNALDMLLHGF